MSKMASDFNTVQYCLDNNIPCFTFDMDATKTCKGVRWNSITQANYRSYVKYPRQNGFAILTGVTHFVVDFDEKKYQPPQEIKEFLFSVCDAVEETPGGYHYWFKIDERTESFDSGSNIRWKGQSVTGLDLRAKKGLCYTTPSHYTREGVEQIYHWIKGDLSTATIPPLSLLTYLSETNDHDFDADQVTIQTYKENDKTVMKITPTFGKKCLVKEDYTHSQTAHSCFFITKLKSGTYTGIATCFSHGKRKITKELCDTLVDYYWSDEADHTQMDEYAQMKEEFERTNFKTMMPVGFYTQIHHQWVFRDRSQMKTAYENLLLSDGSSFLDKWLKDPQMKVYSHVSHQPHSDPSVFVLPDRPPPDFIYKTYGDEPNPNAIPVFDQFLDLITNHRQPIKEYILQWLAHLIQKPLELPGVGIIFMGQKGVGKDTFGDLIGEYIVGRTYYQNYSNQLQYFDKHDTFKANKFLIKVEELSKKVFSDENNDSYFKTSFTSSTISINPKNGTPYDVKNYGRIIGTTNHSNALNIEQKERRYVFSVVSATRLGDHEYWKTLREILFCPSGALAIARMLEHYDISTFNPRVLPENSYLKQLQEDTADSVQTFIDGLESGEYTGADLYNQYRNFCTMEGFSPYTNTKFSTQLSFLMENGTITRQIERKRSKKSIFYIIE